jgi:hypothetical protein
LKDYWFNDVVQMEDISSACAILKRVLVDSAVGLFAREQLSQPQRSDGWKISRGLV